MMGKIETMLLELKDTSEFMVDLAYTSLLFNNVEIAEEVMFLENQMDELGEKITEEIVSLGMEKPQEIARFVVMVRLQIAIENIADAAASIADIVLRGLADNPVLHMSIKDSEWTIEMATVSEGSIMAGKTFGELRLNSHTGMFVIAIRRGNSFIFGPDRHTRIEAGDSLIARGPEAGVGFFKGLADGSEREI
ncbi:MAG: potassium channel protein [Thermoplasmatales archaeon]|nr:potassium channel protein [Thermoplasmatales archaeon]